MNKKGEGVQIEVLIALVLIAVVILVSILFIVRFDIVNKLGILPSNYTQEIRQIDEVEKLRYSIDSGSVDYYDGTSWHNFEKAKAVRLGFKEIDYKRTKTSFDDYYYSPVSREKKGLEEVPKGSFSCNKLEAGVFTIQSSLVMDDNFLIKDEVVINRGDVDVVLRCDGKDMGRAVITLINEIKYSKEASLSDIRLVDASSEPFKTILNKGIVWRDGVLNEPIKIDYDYRIKSNKPDGSEEVVLEPKTVSVCVEKKGKDLWIDLQKQVQEGSKCEN